METECQSCLSPSHLRKMATLAQRAVDYSIRSCESCADEMLWLFWKLDQEWRELNCQIAERGRALAARGTLAEGGSPKDDSGLRLYSAFQVIYTAAAEIAWNELSNHRSHHSPPPPQGRKQENPAALRVKGEGPKQAFCQQFGVIIPPGNHTTSAHCGIPPRDCPA